MHATGERVETLIDELGRLAGPAARSTAEDLVRALGDLYGAGLERVMEIVVDGEAAGVLRRLTEDEVVSGLLVLHDLHPLGTAERVRAALDRVRPMLGLHDGGVELLGVSVDGVVRLRLVGGCDGCASSQATVTGGIERAVRQSAPEVTRLEVEGLPDDSGLLWIRNRPPGPCPVPQDTPQDPVHQDPASRQPAHQDTTP
ncbi:NifU family protein [Sphaerisporangium rubeum]|uniref:NifU family protein n=1 Tax=Sphaerisporangium rubeum TaxID=321317 RepID=UPI0031D5F795